MSVADLKTYTRRIKELEAAIYTERKLMEEHAAVIKTKVPTKPVKRYVERPMEPVRPSDSDGPKYRDIKKQTIYCVVVEIVLISLVVLGVIFDFGLGTFLYLIMAIVAPFTLRIGIEQQKKLNQAYLQRQEQYEKYRDNYSNMMTRYHRNLKDAEDAYQIACRRYDEQLNKYNSNKEIMVNKHYSALASLENALKTLYDEDIIFPKYRNFVAMATINEYLESGRCYELEGPNGAYNLYETELRQNIIINQLSNIIRNLEQIRNNQYALYEELYKSNKLIEDVVYELKDLNKTAKLDAYFNYVTALAETSPKVTYGRIYSW